MTSGNDIVAIYKAALDTVLAVAEKTGATTVAADAIGYFGGDRLKVRRAENIERLVREARERAKVGEPIPVSPSIFLPIAEAACDEERSELQDLWANLLATAMDPATARTVRRSFIDAVKRMDPPDALVLRALTIPSKSLANPQYQVTDRIDEAVTQTGLDRLDVSTSIVRLKSLEIVETQGGSYQPRLSDFGNALVRAVLR